MAALSAPVKTRSAVDMVPRTLALIRIWDLQWTDPLRLDSAPVSSSSSARLRLLRLRSLICCLQHGAKIEIHTQPLHPAAASQEDSGRIPNDCSV